MKKNVTNVDIEYVKKYVNYGNEGFSPIKKTKLNTVGMFILMPAYGILFSHFFSERLSPVIFGTIFLIIIIGGIICTIASDKLFLGNRGYLFLAWLGVTGIGVTCFLTGLVIIDGISNLLIISFIVVHVVIAVLTLISIVKRISSRQIVRDSRKKVGYYGLGGCLGYFGGVILSRALEGVSSDINRMIAAACFMTVSTVLWFGIRRLFQLSYAIKYSIDVINTWDTKNDSFSLSEKRHCPLYNGLIEERICTNINYENEGMLKINELKKVKKELSMLPEEIKQICINCKHFPL